MKGERKSKRRGSSVEFADHRTYTPGDDLRHIDWNVYGRLDKLFLKLFLEEEDLHFYTLLDTSLSMDFGEPTKLHYGKQVAAALSFIGLVNHDRVDDGHVQHSQLEPRDAQRPGPVPDVPRGGVPGRLRQASGKSDLTAAAKAFAIKHSGKGDGRRRVGLPGQARLSGGPALPAGPQPGHLRGPRAQQGGGRAPSSCRRPASSWTPRTTRSPRSPSARLCSNATRTTLNNFVGGIKQWCTQRGHHLHLHHESQPVRQTHPQLLA